MDYTAARWPELQPLPQHQHPHPPPDNTYGVPPPQTHHLTLHHPQSSYSSSSYYPNPNPNPNPLPNYGNPNPAAVPAPAVGPYLPDPYAPHGGYSVGPAAGAVTGAGGGLAGYHYERIGGESYVFAANEAHRQYDAIGYGQVAPGPSNGLNSAGPLLVTPPQWGAKSNYKGGRKDSKPTKLVQSAYCAVCKIHCNSQEILNTHKQGKKHKKNLQKLQESITPKPQRAQATTYPVEKKGPDNGKIVPDEGKTAAMKKAKRKDVVEEDVETKKRKMLEGGAEPKEVRVCTLCNVVVNSEKVYASHVAGSKHAAMIKKQQEAATS